MSTSTLERAKIVTDSKVRDETNGWRNQADFQVEGHRETEDARWWTRKVPGSRTTGQQASRGSRLERIRVQESDARFLVGRMAGDSRRLLVVSQYSCSAEASPPYGMVSRPRSGGGRTAVVVSMQQAESHGGRGFRGVLATGPDCRRRETKRAVGEGRQRESSVALLCSSQNRVKSRAVPDLRANPSWRAGVSSWGSATIASTRRRTVQIQTFHQPSKVKA